jgi:hypothetical protein
VRMRSPGDGLLIAPPRAEKVLSKLSLEFRWNSESVTNRSLRFPIASTRSG